MMSLVGDKERKIQHVERAFPESKDRPIKGNQILLPFLE